MSAKRTLIPILESVLCKKTNKKDDVISNNGIFLKRDNLDVFEVVDFALSDDEKKNRIDLKVGDHVLVTATGDEIEVNPGEIYFLFKQEHVMCKVLNEEN